MKYKTIVAAMLLSGSVNASPGGCVGNCSGGNGSSQPINNTNYAGSIAKSNANSNSKSVGVGIGVGGNSDSRSTSSATGGNAGAASTAFGGSGGSGGSGGQGGQGGSATGGSATGGDATGVGGNSTASGEQTNNQTYNEADSMRYSGSYEVKTVGVAVAPDIQATAGCRKPISAGAGWMGGAFSFGSTFLDETCVRGEMIRFGLTSNDQKTRNMTNELLQYDLAKELEIARKAEAKESAKKVSNYQVDATASAGFDILNLNY